MRRIALCSLGLALAALPAQGQGLVWQPAPQQPANAATLSRPIAGPSTPVVRAQMGDTPAINVPDSAPPVYPQYYPPPPNYYAPPPGYYPPPPSNYQPPANYPPAYNGNPISTKGDPVRRTSFSSRSSTSKFGENAGEFFGGCCDGVKDFCTADGRQLFQSDHCLDSFASPITNPFLFEDPRSLTEVRPIFMWQQIPGSNPVFQGGDVFFYGLQARISLTDWLSFTINKLGGVTFNADNPAIDDTSGMAELWLGPKFTFYRNAECGSVWAAGAIFQIPTGPAKVLQDTGSFSIVPYLSGAQNFGRNSYGSFNVMDTLGYSFNVGGGRSDYLYNSFHIDFDVVNAHRFYPLLELNWFHYTSSGESRPVQFEGADLANVGAFGVSGRDYLTIAPGFRYKFSECVQAGIAAEFPLTSPHDLDNFRLTLDLIFRY
ncbi:MAG: hypothetical protein ACJ8C4_11145 [Gemmataceae bacterium]